MFGERGPRCHAAQFVELTERLAQILEFRAEGFAQLTGRAADVFAGLPQRARRPPDGAGQPLRSQDHQTGDQQNQHLAPAHVEHLYVLLSAPGVTVSVTWRPSRTTSIGAGWPIVNWRTATTNSSASATPRLPTLITTSFSRTPPFSAGLPALTLATCAPWAIALLTDRALTPNVGCTILPSLINVWATNFASLTGIAKPSPLALSDSDLPAVLMPMT